MNLSLESSVAESFDDSTSCVPSLHVTDLPSDAALELGDVVIGSFSTRTSDLYPPFLWGVEQVSNLYNPNEKVPLDEPLRPAGIIAEDSPLCQESCRLIQSKTS